MRRRIDQARQEIEAHGPHARLSIVLELAMSIDAFTTATPRALPFEFTIASMVAVLSVPWQLAWTMTFAKTEEIAQLEQLLLGRVVWRVFALRREGKFRRRPEDMAMRIDRARRRLNLGFDGLRQ